MQPDPLPSKDTFGRAVRGVCGALLGAAIALWWYLFGGPLSVAASMLMGAACIGVCAGLAIRFGDSFWHAVLRWLR